MELFIRSAIVLASKKSIDSLDGITNNPNVSIRLIQASLMTTVLTRTITYHSKSAALIKITTVLFTYDSVALH